MPGERCTAKICQVKVAQQVNAGGKGLFCLSSRSLIYLKSFMSGCGDHLRQFYSWTVNRNLCLVGDHLLYTSVHNHEALSSSIIDWKVSYFCIALYRPSELR